MSFSEFNLEVEHIKTERELRWTHTRELLAMQYNINRKKGAPVMTGSKIIKLSFDELNEPEPMTREERENALKKFKKWLA